MNKRTEEYLAEFEKFKHVQIEVGKTYRVERAKVQVISYSAEENVCCVMDIHSRNKRNKTAHWARKHLTPEFCGSSFDLIILDDIIGMSESATDESVR